MRVTILKQPCFTINGMMFNQWQVGETYDVSPYIATLLIAEDCARLEMRNGTDRRLLQRIIKADRRRAAQA